VILAVFETITDRWNYLAIPKSPVYLTMQCTKRKILCVRHGCVRYATA